MNGRGKSDGCVVPEKPSNKGGDEPSAERVEGRRPAKGNPAEQNRLRTLRRARLQQALDRVRKAARKDKEKRFTALWHHVYNPERLREAFGRVDRKAAPGVDGETWQHYAENLEGNLQDLSAKLKRGAYRARPVRRVYIPKADGQQRPIGVPALEDKIVQRATVEVLNAVYETDFLGFSYGFRPGRSQHNALDALAVGIDTKRVNWVLDADIRGFFDAIEHEWLIKFIEHRIADKRIVRHIKKWLKAGVLENGESIRTTQGTPQGGSVSPLLANVYLHYVFDLWAHSWRKRRAHGDVVIVRYADDFVVGFERREEAEQFLADLKERFLMFGLELHPDKTRLIEFGRFAAERREGRGDGKPDTFDFLGFTHACGKTRRGKFALKRKTSRKRLLRKLQSLKVELRRRINYSVSEVGTWLRSVICGHFRYYGVPGNIAALAAFRHWVERLWLRTLRRRSHKARMPWDKMYRLSQKWLPSPRIVHPHPNKRLYVTTRGRSPVR